MSSIPQECPKKAHILYIFALSAILAVFTARAWPSFASVVDDAWITARYARNLAMGNGLVYNVGQPPVEGYTNLLYVLLTGLSYRLGADMHAAMVGWGFFFGLLGLVAVTALTRRLMGIDSPWTLVPAAWLALDAHYAVVATNGIESSMFIAGVAGACALVLASEKPEKKAISWAAALVSGLLVAVRPEGLAVALALSMGQLWARRHALKLPSSWAVLLGTLTVALPVWIGRRLYFGDWLPNTYRAKAHKALWDQISFNLDYLASDAAFWVGAALLLLAALLVPPWKPQRMLVGLVALGLVVVAFSVDMWMPGGRLLLPSVALGLALAGARLGELAKRGFRFQLGVATVATGLALPLVVGGIPRHVYSYDRHNTALPGNPAEGAARHLADHAPPGAVLATRDAGVLAFFVGPDVSISELHPRALTRLHDMGQDAAFLSYTPRQPEFFIATVQRANADKMNYPQDRRIWERATKEDQDSYRYLGRVYQHYHRFYDVFVRADLDVPPLPADLVLNFAGAPDPATHP